VGGVLDVFREQGFTAAEIGEVVAGAPGLRVR
jgi:hypothetical protein